MVKGYGNEGRDAMRTLSPLRLAAFPALVAAGLWLAVGAAPALAEEDIIGAEEFRISCAPCHGAGGRGDGPVAEYLNKEPGDLTRLSEANGGQFPINDVIKMIDGRKMVEAHGDRAMPIWGDRYDAQMPPGVHPQERMFRDNIIHGRILQLVNYLQAIQQPEGTMESLLGTREE